MGKIGENWENFPTNFCFRHSCPNYVSAKQGSEVQRDVPLRKNSKTFFLLPFLSFWQCFLLSWLRFLCVFFLSIFMSSGGNSSFFVIFQFFAQKKFVFKNHSVPKTTQDMQNPKWCSVVCLFFVSRFFKCPCRAYSPCIQC